MPFVPFAEYLPDQPDFHNVGSSTIKNVVPLTASSYGPMPTLQAAANPLGHACQGAYAFLDASGIAHVFAGDSTKLYKLSQSYAPGLISFTDVSARSYLTPPISTAPVSAAGFWSMTSWGERIIATNFADDVQTMLLGTDAAFSNLSPGAPRARYAAAIRDFLFLANTFDVQSGMRPHRLHWSAIGDPTSFPIPGTNAAVQLQSDFQDLQQTDLGHITGLVGGGFTAADGLAFCERGVYRIGYTATPGVIFEILVAQGVSGTQSPLSIVTRHIQSPQTGSRQVCYYLGEDGFYMCDGVNAVPIGNQKIDRFFFADSNPMFLSYVQGAADPKSKLIFWAYASSTNTVESAPFDRLLVYNWDLNRWAFCDLTGSTFEWLVMALTPGYTLDQLQAIAPGGILDNLTPPLDSRTWIGGFPLLGVFNSSHALALTTGPNMAPTVETSEIEVIPGRRAKILGARPMVDGGTASISVGHRETPYAGITFEAAVPANVLGDCPQRTTGRYARFRLTLPAASTFTHLGGIDVNAQPEGRR